MKEEKRYRKCVIDIAVGDCGGKWESVLENGVINKRLNKHYLTVFVFRLVSVMMGSRNTLMDTMNPAGIFSIVEHTPGPMVLMMAM